MKKLVSIVASMYNEQDVAELFCSAVLNVMHSLSDKYDTELILIDDGSADKTPEIISRLFENNPAEITVIRLSRNFGLEGAINCGLKKAAGDCVIVMDADMQDPPETIPAMLEQWELGADVVNARRANRDVDSKIYKLCAGWYYKFLIMFAEKMHVERDSSVFRLLSRRAADEIIRLSEVNTEFRVLIPFIGMKNAVVYYVRGQRGAGKSKFNFSSRFEHLVNSVTNISIKPLRLLALFIPVTALVFLTCLICLIFVDSSFWRPALFAACISSFCTTVLLFAVCVIAEYIAQIVTEVKGRPASIIYEYQPCKNACEKIKEK